MTTWQCCNSFKMAAFFS